MNLFKHKPIKKSPPMARELSVKDVAAVSGGSNTAPGCGPSGVRNPYHPGPVVRS